MLLSDSAVPGLQCMRVMIRINVIVRVIMRVIMSAIVIHSVIVAVVEPMQPGRLARGSAWLCTVVLAKDLYARGRTVVSFFFVLHLQLERRELIRTVLCIGGRFFRPVRTRTWRVSPATMAVVRPPAPVVFTLELLRLIAAFVSTSLKYRRLDLTVLLVLHLPLVWCRLLLFLLLRGRSLSLRRRRVPSTRSRESRGSTAVHVVLPAAPSVLTLQLLRMVAAVVEGLLSLMGTKHTPSSSHPVRVAHILRLERHGIANAGQRG